MAREHEVWKFEVPAGIVHTDRGVPMPVGAHIIDVAAQGTKVYVWAIVAPDAPQGHRRLGYFGTGAPIPAGWEHVGTAHLQGVSLVFHVFEEVPF